MKINIFYDKLNFRIKDGKKIKRLVESIITKEQKISGDINIVFTDDNTLKELNIKFLKHNYFTDVISFSYNEEKVINGEIFISIDTVRINSINYNVSLKQEILRVIIHGTLHLCGYEDDNKAKREKMSEKENEWIKVFFS